MTIAHQLAHVRHFDSVLRRTLQESHGFVVAGETVLDRHDVRRECARMVQAGLEEMKSSPARRERIDTSVHFAMPRDRALPTRRLSRRLRTFRPVHFNRVGSNTCLAVVRT